MKGGLICPITEQPGLAQQSFWLLSPGGHAQLTTSRSTGSIHSSDLGTKCVGSRGVGMGWCSIALGCIPGG